MGKSLNFTEAVDRLHEWKQRFRVQSNNTNASPFHLRAMSSISAYTLNSKNDDIKRFYFN